MNWYIHSALVYQHLSSLRVYSEVQLTSLNLSYNKLTSISSEIAVFTALTILDVRYNYVHMYVCNAINGIDMLLL